LNALRSLGNVAADFIGRRRLFLNGGHHVIHIPDRCRNFFYITDRAGVGLLDRVNPVFDLLSGMGSLPGQFFNLVGYDCKTSSGFTGPRRFDSGVERLQVTFPGSISMTQKHPQNNEPLAIFSEIPLRYTTDNVKIALFLHTLVFLIGSQHEYMFNRYKTSVIERGSNNVDKTARLNEAYN
jgi:hypothetical protein